METLNWSKFNSGGGCIVHCANIPGNMNFQMSDECLMLVSGTHEEYWELESWEEQEPLVTFAQWIHTFSDIFQDVTDVMKAKSVIEYLPQIKAYYEQEFNEEDEPSPFSKVCVLPNGHTFFVYQTDRICDVYEIFESAGYPSFFAPFVANFIEEMKNVRR